jgi:hypothetical protein
MECSHIHFQILSSETYELLNDGLLIIKKTSSSFFFFLALDIMETTIGTSTNNPVIIALVNNPTFCQTLVRLNDGIYEIHFVGFRHVDVDKHLQVKAMS